MGHVRDLPKSTLGVEVEHDFQPKYLVPRDKSQTVKELKAGRVEFKNDDFGIVHLAVGKRSFEPAQIAANARAVLQTIQKMKPSAAKGVYVRSVTLSSTMGPGVKVAVSDKF